MHGCECAGVRAWHESMGEGAAACMGEQVMHARESTGNEAKTVLLQSIKDCLLRI
jgi:hypothetical protein